MILTGASAREAPTGLWVDRRFGGNAPGYDPTK